MDTRLVGTNERNEWEIKLNEKLPRLVLKIDSNTENIRNVLVFQELSRIVISTNDHKIRILDLTSGEVLKTLEYHSSDVNGIVKWGKDSFLTCSHDGQILEFSASEMKLKRVVVKSTHEKFDSIIRIGPDSLISLEYEHEFVNLIRFSTGFVYYKMEIDNLGFDLLRSQLHNNTFYVTRFVDDSDTQQCGAVKMVSVEEQNTLKIVNEFFFLRNRGIEDFMKDIDVQAFNVYTNQNNNHEILMCGTFWGSVYFFDTSVSSTVSEDPNKSLIRVFRLPHYDTSCTTWKSCLSISHKNEFYSLFMNFRGGIFILDVKTLSEKKEEVKIVCRTELPDYCFDYKMSLISSEPNIEFLVWCENVNGTRYWTTPSLKIFSIDLEENKESFQKVIDEKTKSRHEYFKNEFLMEEQSRKVDKTYDRVIKIKFKENTSVNIYKILML